MRRLPRRVHNWLLLLALVVYAAFACGASFLHNHGVQEPGDVVVLVCGPPAGPFGATVLRTSTTPRAAAPDGDCIACLWLSHGKKSFALPPTGVAVTLVACPAPPPVPCRQPLPLIVPTLSRAPPCV